MTAFANTCALILPFGPIVSTWSRSSNRAFDLPLDGQVFAAVQLALDDDRFADVHDVPLHAGRLGSDRVPAVAAAGGAAAGCWRGRLSAGAAADRFIAFPHVNPPPVRVAGARGLCRRSGSGQRSPASIGERAKALSSPFVADG